MPLSALFRHGDGWAVFAVDDGHARLRPVNTGPRNGQVAVILSGLEPGTQVIAYPADSISEATRIAVRGSTQNK